MKANGIFHIRLGKISGNVYAVDCGEGFVLIDTGLRSRRKVLIERLAEIGCTPGRLKAILLTHSDFDHTGNAAFLRRMFDAPVGIHKDDALAVESGDMFINRQKKNKFISFLIRIFMGIEKFTPDSHLDEQTDLGRFGLDAKVLHTPGHSPGSVCIVMSGGECFCGDLFENVKVPQINKIVDNKADMVESCRKVLAAEVAIFYPGHGKPFEPLELTDDRGPTTDER